MGPQISEETWDIINEFFRKNREVLSKLAAVQKAFKEGEQRGRRKAIQCVIIKVLQRKFGALPEEIVQTIEGTQSIEQLDQWLQEALNATSLTEINVKVI